ncbi:hypothetical protein [Arenimonas sp.]|uniref:hypothetical protein n=1 Tax=Arenimonas sp. TaxID=1872635 RepID=UPI0039E5B4B1
MARIPSGVGSSNPQFGNRGPDRPTEFRPDTRGLTAGLDAAVNAGQEGLSILSGKLNQMRAAEAQQNEDLARAKASNAQLDHQLEVRTRVRDIGARVDAGDLDWREAEAEALKALDDIPAPDPVELGPAGMEIARGGYKRNKAAGLADVAQMVAGAKRSEAKGTISSTRDSLGKLALEPDADLEKIVAQDAALRDTALRFGIDPDVFDKGHQDFADRVYSDHATARLVASKEDQMLLDALEADLGKGGRYYGKMDSAKITTLQGQILTARSRLEARAESALTKREAKAERAIKQYDEQISTAIPPTIEDLQSWADAVEGTSMEAEFRERLADEVEVQQMLRRPPAEQRAYLQQEEVRQRAQGASVREQRNFARMKSAMEAQLKLLKDSPLEFNANLTGEPVQPLALQSLFDGDTSILQSQIAARMNTLGALRKKYGGEAGTSPLLPGEASAISGALAQAKPAQVVKLFSSLRTVFGDDDGYRAVMQQIAPDSPVRARAGELYLLQRKNGVTSGLLRGADGQEYGDIATHLLKGEALLNPAKGDREEDGRGAAFKMPPAQQFEAEFANLVGQSFAGRPEEYRAALQSVRAYYASVSADAGAFAADQDDDLVATAVHAIVGQPVEYNDGDVLPPWGMSATVFENIADTFVAERLKAAGLEDPGDVSLRNARGRDGVYILQRGNEFVPDKNGLPLTIRIGGR